MPGLLRTAMPGLEAVGLPSARPEQVNGRGRREVMVEGVCHFLFMTYWVHLAMKGGHGRHARTLKTTRQPRSMFIGDISSTSEGVFQQHSPKGSPNFSLAKKSGMGHGSSNGTSLCFQQLPHRQLESTAIAAFDDSIRR